MAACRHCGRDKLIGRATRGLCWRCYHHHDIRRLYPIPGREDEPNDDPTEAELEQTIAQQMKCLPSWWESDSIRLNQGELGRTAIPVRPLEGND